MKDSFWQSPLVPLPMKTNLNIKVMRKQNFYDLGRRKVLSLAFKKPCDSNDEVSALREKGIDAYFAVNSENEIKEIISVINTIIHGNGIINLDSTDVRSILYDAHHAYYSRGIGSGVNALKIALNEANGELDRRGANFLDAKKLLISIGMPAPDIYNQGYVMQQMNAFMEFQSQLPEEFDLKFCLMPVEGKETSVSAFIVTD